MRHLRQNKFLLFALLPFVSACADRHFEIFGYTTASNYDCTIKTVYVPIFKNRTFRRGIEFDMTRAVIREIESKTPYKVVDCEDRADTVLLGSIVMHRKQLINTNQLNEVRDAQVSLAAEIVWRDLRSGKVLSIDQSRQPQGGAVGVPPPPSVPGQSAAPILITPTANFVPELGGSITSAEKSIMDQLAVQIVSMMEVWPVEVQQFMPAVGDIPALEPGVPREFP